MAENWKDVPGLSRSVYNMTGGPGDGDDNVSNKKVAVKLQYDANSVTTTSMKVRFYGWTVDGVNYLDSFYILYNPTSNDRTLYLLKYYYKSYQNPYTWPTSTSSFTLYKEETATTYELKDFWICNDGYAAAEGSSSWNSNNSKAYNFYSIFGSGWRKGFVSKQGKRSFNITKISGAYLTSVKAGSKPTIVNNRNNSYTVTGYLGSAGTNNPMAKNVLYYTGADGKEKQWPSPSTTDPWTVSKSHTVTVSFTPAATDTADTRRITAYTKTFGKNYNKSTGVKSIISTSNIRQYVQPTQPGKPVLSWTKSRLTVKEALTYEWPKAKARNKYSPVMGYRLRLYKNGTVVNISNTDTKSTDPYFDTDVNTLKKGFSLKGQNDSSAKTIKLTFDPAALGFAPKDKIKLKVLAYSRYGEKDKETNSGSLLFNQTSVSSDELVIQNAGIVNVRLNNKWVEGTPFVRLKNGTWQEADTVNVRISTTWKESE